MAKIIVRILEVEITIEDDKTTFSELLSHAYGVAEDAFIKKYAPYMLMKSGEGDIDIDEDEDEFPGLKPGAKPDELKIYG